MSKSLPTSVQLVKKRSTIICKQPTCNNPENLWPCQLCYWYPLILDLIITQLDPYWLLLSFCSFSTQFLVISKIYHYFSNLLLEVRDHKGSKKDIAWFWGKLASNLGIFEIFGLFLGTNHWISPSYVFKQSYHHTLEIKYLEKNLDVV